MLPPRQRINLIKTIDKINRNPNFSKKLQIDNSSYFIFKERTNHKTIGRKES